MKVKYSIWNLHSQVWVLISKELFIIYFFSAKLCAVVTSIQICGNSFVVLRAVKAIDKLYPIEPNVLWPFLRYIANKKHYCIYSLILDFQSLRLYQSAIY